MKASVLFGFGFWLSNHRIDRCIPAGGIETLETTVGITKRQTAELVSVNSTTEDFDKECQSWHEKKQQLRQMYECSVEFTLETGLSSAFYIFDISGEPTLGKLSLQEYVAKHGYEEAVVWAHENIPEKPYWLIDCVGGEFTQEANAFENAWRSREHYHESGDGVRRSCLSFPLPPFSSTANAEAVFGAACQSEEQVRTQP
jgi:hypothetical protein